VLDGEIKTIMAKKRILIAGAYGVGNLGDEAILAGTLNLMRANSDLRKNEVIVFSRNPSETEKIHRIETRRRNPVDLLRSDEVIIGGGELFQSFGNMAIKYSLLGLICKTLRKNLIFHAIGASSDLGRVEKMFTRLSLNVADQITVRDKASKRRLLDLGVNKTINILDDPAIYVKPITQFMASFLLEKEGIQTNKNSIRIAIVSQLFQNRKLNDEFYRFLLEFLKDFLSKNSDINVIFVPFNKHFDKPLDSDIIYGKWLEKQLKTKKFKAIEGNYSPSQMMGIIGLMDIVLSTRLHPLIFATKMKVSAIGIGVFDKTIAFCKHHKIPLVKASELKKIPVLINNLIKNKPTSNSE